MEAHLSVWMINAAFRRATALLLLPAVLAASLPSRPIGWREAAPTRAALKPEPFGACALMAAGAVAFTSARRLGVRFRRMAKELIPEPSDPVFPLIVSVSS